MEEELSIIKTKKPQKNDVNILVVFLIINFFDLNYILIEKKKNNNNSGVK